MKYQLMLRSRPAEGETVQEKHQSFRSALMRLEGSWSGSAGEWPAVTDPGTRPKQDVKLDGRFGRGVRGHISYQNRKYVPDAAMYDDYLVLDFDPAKIDYRSLVHEYFEKYIEFFHAYIAYITDIEFYNLDFDEFRRVDQRHGIYRIFPVSFFDAQLCREGLAITPEEVAERLAGTAEQVRVHCGGVLILATTTPLPFKAAVDLSDRLMQQLCTRC